MATQTSSEAPMVPRVPSEPANVDASMTAATLATNSETPLMTRTRPPSDMDEVLGLKRRLQ